MGNLDGRQLPFSLKRSNISLRAAAANSLTLRAGLPVLRASKFYEDIINIEDAFPVRLADNRVIGLSAHRFDFSGQRLARIGREHIALPPRRAEEALCAHSAEGERLPLESPAVLLSDRHLLQEHRPGA